MSSWVRHCNSATAASYLRTWLVRVCTAGVHVLRHDDESQEVGGGERAGVTAAGGSRESERKKEIKKGREREF